MSWLAPAAFGWFALLAILLVIYLLRPRRRRIVVPSLMLWLEDDRNVSGSTFWRWLRRHLLLILQVLALLALIFSLSRPARSHSERIAPDLVLIVDGSGRFTTPAGTGTLFESARLKAREYVEGLDSPAAVSIILATNLPQIVAVRETGIDAVGDALRELEPGYGPADVEAALEIGQSILRDGPGGSIAIVSDGRFRITNSELLANAGLVEVAPGAAELRIDRVTARQAPGGGMQVLVGVASTFADSSAVDVTLSAGGEQIASQTVQVPANGWAGTVFEDVRTASAADITVALGGRPASESRADANHSRMFPLTELRAAVVSGEPSSYIRALDILPNVIVQGIAPASYDPEAKFDLYIFDRFVPETLPQGSMIFFNPPLDNVVFEVSAEVSGSLPIKAHNSLLLQFVDLSFLEPGEGGSISIPEWSRPDLLLDAGAAMFHGILDGRRTVVASFDPVDAGMTDTAAFPMFMMNAVEWANPLRALPDASHVSVGQKLHVQPHPQATDLEVSGSNGEAAGRFDAAEAVAIGPFYEAGVYRLTQVANTRTLGVEEFTVHAPWSGDSPLDSKIRLGPPPALLSAGLETRAVNSEIWMWIALAALLVMGAEWLWFHKVRAAG